MEDARTGHDGAVRIAERDARSHVYQFIDEKHARFEHLFEDEHRAFDLRCDDRHNARQIGRKARPRSVVDFRRRVSDIAVYFKFLPFGNGERRAVDIPCDAEFAETEPERPHILRIDAFDRERTASSRRESDKRTDFHIVRAYRTFAAVQGVDSFDA